MSLYPTPEVLTAYHHQYSNPSSSSSSPEMSVRPDSPVDTRRHRAKRKAYVENLENTVHQLRAALAASGSSPDIATQIQYLEQENARLRAESQALRAQLGASATSPTTPTSSAGIGYGNVGGSAYGATGDSSAGQQLRLPSVADAMVHNPLLLSHFPDLPKLTTEPFLPPPQNLRGPSSFGQSAALPNYFQDSDAGSSSSGAGAGRTRYYESTSDYRRRVSQPYIVPRRDSAPAVTSAGGSSSSGNYDSASTSRIYDNSERISGSDSAARSSQRSYQSVLITVSTEKQPQTSASSATTPTSAEPQESGSYSYTHQLYNAPPSAVTPSFPPASGTASSYVFGGNEDVKPYVP
ncbi:hypothetical protein FS837_000395 [Tulasnella sp. UAMH 9824]|nr:hypothetical protein FS837_000395 [Tulasnella sp. UAMH 9824]